MPIDRYYTPQALADATGLRVSQCRTLIAQSPDRLCISRNPQSKKKRWAISERGFRELVDRSRKNVQIEQFEREQARRPKPKQKPRPKAIGAGAGLTPDGKIMTRRQLKEAGLWKEEKPCPAST